jgi:hypothetical protein
METMREEQLVERQSVAQENGGKININEKRIEQLFSS